jgi:hypothetical protein
MSSSSGGENELPDRVGGRLGTGLASGQPVLDAAETMRRFLAGNRPDPDGFEQVIAGLIRQAGCGW